MSFFSRMRAQTGHLTPTWEYLVDKIGHVSFLTLALILLAGIAPMRASLIAAAAYVVIGKLLWFAYYHEFDARDAVFDFVLGLLVAIMGVVPERGWLIAGGFFAAWCCAIAAGSNNRWGSPS